MRWITLVLVAIMLLGCGSKPTASEVVTRRPSGPTVDVTVEPILAGGIAAKAESGRAQQMTPEPAEPPTVQPSSTQQSANDYADRRTNTAKTEIVEARPARKVEVAPKPKRKRKRTRPVTESQDSPGDTQITRREDSQPHRKREKRFEDLSQEERRRLIEGG